MGSQPSFQLEQLFKAVEYMKHQRDQSLACLSSLVITLLSIHPSHSQQGSVVSTAQTRLPVHCRTRVDRPRQRLLTSDSSAAGASAACDFSSNADISHRFFPRTSLLERETRDLNPAHHVHNAETVGGITSQSTGEPTRTKPKPRSISPLPTTTNNSP